MKLKKENDTLTLFLIEKFNKLEPSFCLFLLFLNQRRNFQYISLIEWDVRFTTVPLSEQDSMWYLCFNPRKFNIFVSDFFWLADIFMPRKQWKTLSETKISLTFLSNKDLKWPVFNLNWISLEITMTVPWKINRKI